MEERDAQRKREAQRREAEREAVARGQMEREAQRKRLQAERESVRDAAQRVHVEREEERLRAQQARSADREAERHQQIDRANERKRVLLDREAKRLSGHPSEPSPPQPAARVGGESKKPPAISGYVVAEFDESESANRAMWHVIGVVIVVFALAAIVFAFI
ncbi:MAG TPA: hypothetical protein VJV78_43205 [Polyangiales bacterium]|nr:hypothetical protein [Polyangiales bacterium]